MKKKNVLLEMPSGDYKKWVIVSLAIVMAVFIVILFISKSSDNKTAFERAQPPSPRSGPLIEQAPEAIREFDPFEELGVDTNNPQELAILGDRYFEARNYAQAIEIYKKVLELNPSDVDTYNDLGLAYHYTGRSNSAIDTLRKGGEIDPSYQRVWISLGYVLMSVGQNEEAKPALQKAVNLNPGNEVGIEAKKMLDSLS